MPQKTIRVKVTVEKVKQEPDPWAVQKPEFDEFYRVLVGRAFAKLYKPTPEGAAGAVDLLVELGMKAQDARKLVQKADAKFGQDRH